MSVFSQLVLADVLYYSTPHTNRCSILTGLAVVPRLGNDRVPRIRWGRSIRPSVYASFDVHLTGIELSLRCSPKRGRSIQQTLLAFASYMVRNSSRRCLHSSDTGCHCDSIPRSISRLEQPASRCP